MIELGSLVQSQKNYLGIGKVTEISQPDVMVEYFCSGGQRLQKTLPLDSLTQVRLKPQTRCYISSSTQDKWLIGRICTWDEDTEMYQIDLPDKKTTIATEQEIYVRCNIPISDPIETLAMKGHETPYFHDRRLTFVKSLIHQRAVSREMTGLISANIELYPHQVEVVRRVLEDPIQRYLLADEVGLGKTIEAGAILRQFLLDEPKKGAVVLVPQYLLQQWRTELENKFYISHFGKRVVVLAVEDIHRINLTANIGCLIVDEAHHIAAMATSGDAAVRQRFESCKILAHKSDRLLLLSATPVLNHEQDFLAILHLLDPITYKLHDLTGFRARVKKYQEIGKFLLSFQESAKNDKVLTTHLKELQNLFAEDGCLMNLADNLKNCLKANPAEKEEIILAIRNHINETYRLHRRMLRNRRAAIEDVIFDRDVRPKEEYDLDERSLDLHQLMEKWRTLAPKNQQYQRIFLVLFLASGTWLGILEQVITSRLAGKSSCQLIREFKEYDLSILTTTAKFPEEEEILQCCLKILRQSGEEGERTQNLHTLLLNQLAAYFKISPSIRRNKQELITRIQHRIRRPIPGDVLPKIVVFTSFAQSCQQIVQCLSHSFGAETVASHQFSEPREKVEANLTRFQNNPKCFILVCERSGEEGLNLQFADCLIHFDLPWSPNQLEQRIGRFDRIGSKIGIQSFALIGPYLEDNPQNAWYQLLKNGFGIFEKSIASLQFYVDEKLGELETALLQSGAAGLLAMIEPIQQEITAETLKISEQTALDEIDILDGNTTQYFQDLDDYDASHLEIKQATEGWMCDALGFKSVNEPNSVEIRRYKPTTRTLVSVDELKTHFANNNTDQFGTYNRRIANQNSGVKLFRIGEGLIEALVSYINWDDRGKAFALWRTDESWDATKGKEWFGFRFNYVVETHLANAKQVLTNHKLDSSHYKTLKRRVDAFFPPMLETIFVDARCHPMSLVEDELLLNILQRPYKDRSSDKSRDFNLAKERLGIIDAFVHATQWQNFCHQARSSSAELLLKNPEFMVLHEQYAQITEEKLNKKVEQLHLRLNWQNEDDALAAELQIESALRESILAGIRQPQIRLDSVGFMIVSGRNPL
ncbi:protein DpdE [Umezakia ovalisporum]|jgi:ATP-dependent helicase HepA|uniref:Protein DpdE n=2 Tax=Umezakia ovalisporum TaxID=75695 RepID=A0AA43GWT3_9CYAN|nr:protein DpdE [Umezakia ovalisporum]MDH6057973.1 protein DpdE [Umezakia ovalisporum FSS-43]MDH6063054.1 protein DpdE [Umezakia ovalisporum FSS-62]MDH6066893.1 protein DpdE [Umezakia ovalisporum APH033B]MDH6071996.1 protein DpdE [Umezakia ovalisporum CobakiLakeA]MDH6074213.1 protein DpdE [Umezakia ovalisporum CS-1034]